MTIAWQIYTQARLKSDIPHAAFAVGIVGLVQFASILALTLVGGETADRSDRRTVALVCMAVEAATATALALLTWLGNSAIWPIYVVAACFGASRAFYYPSITALGPMLVRRSLLPRAIAWNQLAYQAAAILGPALGGLLCAVSISLSYSTSFLLYFSAALGLLVLGRQVRPDGLLGSRWSLVKEGVNYVWKNKIIFGAISLDLFAVLFGGATALLPVFARDVLHVGALGFAVLRTSPAVGAAVVALFLSVRPIRRKAGAIMFGGVALYSLATIVFALSNWIVTSTIALTVVGGADMLSVFIRQTLVQVGAPDAMRGRVAAASTLFTGASGELGQFESGLAARFLGPVGAALLGGAGALVVTGAWAKLFPDLRNADRLVPQERN